MASEGEASLAGGPYVSPVGHRSWANVVKQKESASVEPPLNINQKENLEKLKKSASAVVIVGKDLKDRVSSKMSNSLFGKFLGRAPPLELVRTSLQEM